MTGVPDVIHTKWVEEDPTNDQPIKLVRNEPQDHGKTEWDVKGMKCFRDNIKKNGGFSGEYRISK